MSLQLQPFGKGVPPTAASYEAHPNTRAAPVTLTEHAIGLLLASYLMTVFTDAGASPDQAAEATATIDPQILDQLPESVRDGIVTAYADALAPVFWYVLPFIGLAFLLSLFLKQVPLSDVAGLVARGEAVGGEEAERLEAAQRHRGSDAMAPGTEASAAAPGSGAHASEDTSTR